MFLFLLPELYRNDDLRLVRDLLANTKVMLDLDPELIKPLERIASRSPVTKKSFPFDAFIDNVRRTLAQAVEVAVAEEAHIGQMTSEEQSKLLTALNVSGLTGSALRAKVESFRLLWEKLVHTVKRFNADGLDALGEDLKELLHLMQSIWGSLKRAVPGAEQIEELLALLEQLVYHVQGFARGEA
jgi:hypothetical protein